MISSEVFQAAMTGLLQMLPMQRQLTGPALVMAWDSFPMTAKQELNEAMLHWACSQRLKDPEPPKELATHLSLLRYLYPLENDRAVIERGLRPDLAERMAEPDRFHDPAPARQEYQAARRLPEGSFWHPNQMIQAERCRHLEVIAIQLEAAIAQGEDNKRWTDAQLAQGHWWFKQALSGFWNLKADKGGIAKAWISRNPEVARQMLQQVREVEQVEAVEHVENPVDAFLAGAW